VFSFQYRGLSLPRGRGPASHLTAEELRELAAFEEAWRTHAREWERVLRERREKNWTMQEMRYLCAARELPTTGSVTRLQWRLQRWEEGVTPRWTDPEISKVA